MADSLAIRLVTAPRICHRRRTLPQQNDGTMGINRQTDFAGELQIGPTTLGQVRIYVAGDNIDLPMDFSPEEAREIAAELIEAADRAEADATPRAPKQQKQKTRGRADDKPPRRGGDRGPRDGAPKKRRPQQRRNGQR